MEEENEVMNEETFYSPVSPDRVRSEALLPDNEEGGGEVLGVER